MIDVLPVPSSPMTRILYRCSFFSPPPACEHTYNIARSVLLSILYRSSFFSPPPACEHTYNIARSVLLPPSCTGLKQVLPLLSPSGLWTNKTLHVQSRFPPCPGLKQGLPLLSPSGLWTNKTLHVQSRFPSCTGLKQVLLLLSPSGLWTHMQYCSFSLASHPVQVLHGCSFFSPPQACEHTIHRTSSLASPNPSSGSGTGALSSLPLRPVNPQNTTG